MKYQDLVSSINAPFFSKNDILLAGAKVYDYQLTRWSQKGYIIKLKNGIYAFSKDYEIINGNEVASLIYQPSYLSLESALSFYGFIPEIVYAYVSVTGKTNRKFTNKFGNFIYRHIKSELFWGYREVKTENWRYLIAEPEKAVLDYLYLNMAKINSSDDFENIRFNYDMLGMTLDKEKFIMYLQAFGIIKMERWAAKCLH